VRVIQSLDRYTQISDPNPGLPLDSVVADEEGPRLD
jgi:hypothetical protein